MKTNNHSTRRNTRMSNKPEKKSFSTLRIFSIVMLLLIALSTFGRMASASHPATQNRQPETIQRTQTPGAGTVARVLVFHQENKAENLCEDLVITVAGGAIYSDCGKITERQYVLNESELQQLLGWIEKFQVVNYDHKVPAQTGDMWTKIYLNGVGSQPADDLTTQRMIGFATALVAKIAP